jgi:hypothetical protein
MSSHLDYIKCPHCGHEDALCDINSNAEEMIHCRHCGYHRRFFIANMEDHGKEDWMPQYEIYECSDPYGAYYVQYHDGPGEGGTLVDVDSYKQLLDQIEMYRGEIALATVTRYVDGAITEEVLVDNPHPVV